MEKLIEGYKRFRAGLWVAQKHLYNALAEGQSPRAAVIGCCDSRADPSLIFNAAPGELFVIRNVANLVPPYAPDASYHGTSAALEFAVCGLEVKDILIMGHSSCGGVNALLRDDPGKCVDFVAPWMNMAQSARISALNHDKPAERLVHCTHDVIGLSLKNLMTFPWIAEKVETGKLKLHGAYFDIGTGVLYVRNSDGQFASVD